LISVRIACLFLRKCAPITVITRFIDQDTIEQEWVMYQDGKPVDLTTLGLQRAEPL